MLKNQAEDNLKCDVCGQTFDRHKSSVRHILKDQQAKDNLVNLTKILFKEFSL